MSLTTEQKINLLILAGYEPGRHEVDVIPFGRCDYPRIFGVRGLLARNCRQSWNFWPGRDNGWEPAEWEHMHMQDIPDELIYEAIGATK